MKKESLTEIIKNLEEEEGAESRLIRLYLALIDAGVENCLPETKQYDFRKNLNILLADSERHRQAVKQLLEKYVK